MEHKAFCERVWAIVSEVPPGRVVSYGQLAILAGMPRNARLAGWAMRRAPGGLPCHRVVHSDGTLCPPDMFLGMQRTLLEQEGVRFTKSGKADMKQCGYRPE